jgi:AraC-like DNA-binding protein/effector-binding domain-containing protein
MQGLTPPYRARNIKPDIGCSPYDSPVPPHDDILAILEDVADRLTGDVSLSGISTRAGWSPFHLHRAFRDVAHETPKQYTLRLRLERAAALLAVSDVSVLSIALATGFRSHEVFTRAFRRRFQCTPVVFRRTALRNLPAVTRRRHAELLQGIGPCVQLFHQPPAPVQRGSSMPMLSIERRDLPSQPLLFIQSKVARHEIAATIAQSLGEVFQYAIGAGCAIAGRPLSRYPSTSVGLITIDVGVPIAAAAPGSGRIQAGTLQGGAVVMAVHGGSYDTLGETYAAIERWMEQEKLTPGGAPWESYITDPAEFPDPKDWRTEIYWPVK